MEPPIQNIDAIDLVGERVDRGIDFGLICSGPLDDSADTLQRLRDKLSGYIDAATSPDVWTAYPNATQGPVRILIHCPYAVSAAADALVGSLSRHAHGKGVEVLLERH